jgi:hypothetical protein
MSRKVFRASRSALCLGIVLLTATLEADSAAAKPDYKKYQAPEMFSYAELVTLSNTDPLDDVMSGKLKLLTTTPFVSNEAYYAGAKAHNPSLHGTPSLRVVFWNIERGLRLEEIKLAFTDKRAFLAKMEASAKPKAAPDGKGTKKRALHGSTSRRKKSN